MFTIWVAHCAWHRHPAHGRPYTDALTEPHLGANPKREPRTRVGVWDEKSLAAIGPRLEPDMADSDGGVTQEGIESLYYQITECLQWKP